MHGDDAEVEAIVATLRAENPPCSERVDFGEVMVIINRHGASTLVDVVANPGWRVVGEGKCYLEFQRTAALKETRDGAALADTRDCV